MDNRTQFTMRIDSELWKRLKKIADKNKRSAAKEVEFALEKYVNEEELKELLEIDKLKKRA